MSFVPRFGGDIFGFNKPKPEGNKLESALATVQKYGPSPDEMIDTGITPQQRATLDTISKAEGTYSDSTQSPDYTRRYGDNNNESGTLDITASHPKDVRPSPWGSGYSSNASGAYQFLDSTWKEENEGINAAMTPENQDNAAISLVSKTGFDFNKPFGEEAYKLAPKWASIPNSQGESHYSQPVKKLESLTTFYDERLSDHEEQRRHDVYNIRAGLEGTDESFSAISDKKPDVPEVVDQPVSRKFGQEAVLNGKPVYWGGDDYAWQSKDSFSKIQQNKPSVGPATPAPSAADAEPAFKAPKPTFQAPPPGTPKFGDTNVVTGKQWAGKNYGWQSTPSFNKVAPLFNLGK